MNNTAFFTGSRPRTLGGYRRENYLKLREYITEYLRNVIMPSGIDTFISGGAQGFDQLCFWSIEALKRQGLRVRNLLFLPFPGQEERWSESEPFSRAEYQRMLRMADEVRYIAKSRPQGYAAVSHALLERNTAMMQVSRLCIGLWSETDGLSWLDPNTKSGTADALRAYEFC